ncbi:hypothetical protein PWT90_02811 [Aphanocladium album]|nr:hypothetical protein PWT90_02811 [Aphanocladium album]
MSDDKPFPADTQLQIGIEIEFVAPHNKEWEECHLADIDPFNHISLSKDACFHRLAEALDAVGLPASYQMKTTSLNCSRNPLREQAPADSIVLETYRIMGDASRYKRKDGRAGLFKYWLVKGEYHLTETETYKEWIMCELTSPILSESDISGPFPELDTALTTIAGALDETPHIFSKRSGLHVHISPACAGGSSLLFAQRILTLVVVLDQPVLFPLCDPARRDLIRPFLSAATLAPVDQIVPTHPALDARALAHLPPSLAAAEGRILTFIWRAATLADLQHILEHHRADLLTVAPLLCKHKHAGGGENEVATTVEFRHAQASFSKRFVREWCRLVLAVGRVGVLPVSEYRAALERIWAAVTSGGDDPGGSTLAAVAALSAEAVAAGIAGELDLEYWERRYSEMMKGCNPDIDENGKVVLDERQGV